VTYPEILQRLKSQCSYLTDDGCAVVFVAARAGDEAASAVAASFRASLSRHGLAGTVVAAGSFGYEGLEPIAVVRKAGGPFVLYPRVTPEAVSTIFDAHLAGPGPVPEMALCILGETGQGGIPGASDLPFFRRQTRIALRNCGLIDPEEIDAYVAAASGYKGLHKALEMDPSQVIEEIRASALRGRGGAGYRTAEKWAACRDAGGSEKFVVCNGLDADPLARCGRLLLEGDPHSVLEGALIAAYAVGAGRSIICLDSTHRAAIGRVRKALDQMKSYGLLGRNVLGSQFSVEVEVKEIPPSFLGGEETALLKVIEGRQAMAALRPPYPSTRGLSGLPTVVNSAETLADVSAILQRGSGWFSAIGTEASTGSKVVTLAGDVTVKATVEVPFGTSLRTLIEEVGGGMPPGKSLKAVRIGGPTGAFVGADALDRTLDYETAEKNGTIIGSGTVEVFADDACPVEMAFDAVSFLQAQSCGKCVFCREGTLQMTDVLKSIVEQTGTAQDLELLNELAAQMPAGCLCGLGKGAPNAFLSTLRLFRDEYDAHLKGKGCTAKTVKSGP